MDTLGTLFKKDGDRVFQALVDVADWPSFFHGYSQAFSGTGTARTHNVYYGRSIHAMRVTLDGDGQAVIQYKEFDTDHEPWQGHWNTQEPIQIFPTEERPDGVLRPFPHELVKNLPFVKEKVDAMFKVLRQTVGMEGPAEEDEAGAEGMAEGSEEEEEESGDDEDEDDESEEEEDEDQTSTSENPQGDQPDDTQDQPGQLRKGFTREDVVDAAKFWDAYFEVRWAHQA